ncbi:MAG: hypothetical protein K2X03_29855 [Bryobacteraceae bacterium]|nr:hypothetical protein [Bryobacteraceae bacterium]
MLKLYHFVALALIVAVVGGGQCADFCAFLAVDRSAETAGLPPCHQKQQQTPDPACAHHDIVAEQQLGAQALDSAPALALMATVADAFAPAIAETTMSVDVAYHPPPHRPFTRTTLRI